MEYLIDGKSFGIIITCYKGDLFLTKGLLASIKHFMPEIPICIIQDGDFSIEVLIKTYAISHIIKREDVENKYVKEKCFGSRCSNLVAFFESPFERFMYLDSDIVLWGNVLKGINIKDFDFIYNEPHEKYSDRIYKEQYFDYENIFKYTEKFDWKNCNLFNSGVFLSKKNVFDETEILDLIGIWHENRDLFPTDPQSILNILVFRNKLKKKLKVLEIHLQTVVPVLDFSELERTFQFVNGYPIVNRNTTIHWAGRKPYLMHTSSMFINPMVQFRIQHLNNVESIWRKFPIPYLLMEEIFALKYRYGKKFTLSKLISKLKERAFQ